MTRQEFQNMSLSILQEYGVDIAKVLLLLLFAWIVAGWTRKLVDRALARVNFDATLTSSLLRRVAGWCCFWPCWVAWVSLELKQLVSQR